MIPTTVHFSLLGVVAVGLATGFLSGVFGKGGSTIATPLLHATGVPAVLAVASPLPATIPATAVAAAAYRRGGYLDGSVLRSTLLWGLPATVAGATLSRWVSGQDLVAVTDVLIVLVGLRILLGPSATGRAVDLRGEQGSPSRGAIAAVAVAVGFSAGLLANSGGALLGPLYLTVLRLPVKRAFGSSLAAACLLAVPATLIHAALGHIDWAIVALLGVTSVPMAFVGARIGVHGNGLVLERLYGLALTGLGLWFVAVILR